MPTRSVKARRAEAQAIGDREIMKLVKEKRVHAQLVNGQGGQWKITGPRGHVYYYTRTGAVMVRGALQPETGLDAALRAAGILRQAPGPYSGT